MIASGPPQALRTPTTALDPQPTSPEGDRDVYGIESADIRWWYAMSAAAWLPTRADLDAATARTAAAIEAGAAPADIERLAELEAAALHGYEATGPDAHAELEAGL